MKIRYGSEWMSLDKDGCISRPAIGMKGSGSWRILGAVKMNNFGRTVAHASLADILAGKITDWQFKNGKQKWHIVDFDHGTNRVWMSPDHEVA